MFVKICGVTTRAALDAAIGAGADAVGFVFADSVREISPERAAALTRGLAAPPIRVAVMRHPSAERLARVVDVFAPDWIQTDADDLAALTLRAGLAALPVYRSGRALPASGLPARLLYEGAVSGSGRRADWLEARELAGRAEVVLAGGLSPDNVARAIREVGPWGVDVSSGVEAAPGVKDPRKIRAFVARAKATEVEA